MNEVGLHFARPEWVIALWVWLAAFLVIALLERRGSDLLDRLMAPSLQAQLVDRPARWRRLARLVLLGVSGALLAVALMQPQRGERFVQTPRVGAEIMVAIDVSRSMLADDAKPTRLDRAKAEVRDLLGYLGDDHVGLIAFAGRASVLSPMTPDKSFLLLALDGAGPHSVPRGGTKLAEAIRRTVTGFGPPGPAQRALILITDGEDHDSFAVDAAKVAAAAGIKIIAIGFGDEDGSEIYLRDEKTGARTKLRDRDGRPVVSRLNGDLLREIALVTDGAFVPAGTGVLDLASIYEAHIEKLTRGEMDDRGRTIRDEAYQFFVVGAFVCLIMAVWVTAGRSPSAQGGARSMLLLAGLAGAVVVGGIAAPGSTSAQPGDAPATADVEDDGAILPGPGSDEVASPTSEPTVSPDAVTGAGAAEAPEIEVDPRTRFNEANAALATGDPSAAATLYRVARREGPDDPELRYAATYNLGIAAVARADARLGDDPEAALESLHEASDWFREAVGLRKNDQSARHNLEVTLRRAMILADEIAQANEGPIEEAIDELIAAQRENALTAAGLLEAVSQQGELESVERLAPAFRAAATDERVLISRTDELAARIVREREGILAQPEETRLPEDALRAAQLEGVVGYLDSAIDRMGQTRRQLRQRRAERAYRRSSASLGDLKRARDQLRDPVELIGILLGETRELVGATAALAQQSRPATGTSSEARIPAFLNPTSLEEEARRHETRVTELGARLSQAAAQAAAGPGHGTGEAPAAGEPSAEDLAALEEALAIAAPRVVAAGESVSQAASRIASGEFDAALVEETQAGQGLADAQEAFFDLSRLLVVTHADEARLVEIASSEAPEIAERRAEYTALATELQAKNVERAKRLADLLMRERKKRLQALEAESASAGAPTDPEATDPVALENQRFNAADQLLALAEGSMLESEDALATVPPDWSAVAASASRARDHLDALRQLFFSLVQHLEQLAREQVDLNDSTRDAVALAATETGEGDSADAGSPPPRGPETQARARVLAEDQGGLEERGGQIADALLEASQSAPSEGTPGEGAPDEELLEKMRIAAEHVVTAQLAMREAQSVFAAPDTPVESAVAPQQTALEELAKALALLVPPQPPDESQQDQEQDSQGDEGSSGDPQEQESSPGEDASATPRDTPEADERSPDADPSQLLQGVRDREAERRRDLERRRENQRSQPVDKDWWGAWRPARSTQRSCATRAPGQDGRSTSRSLRC